MMAEVIGLRIPPIEVIEALLLGQNCDEPTRARLLELCRLETELAASGASLQERSTARHEFLRLLAQRIDGHAQMTLHDFLSHFEVEFQLQTELAQAPEELENLVSAARPAFDVAMRSLSDLQAADLYELRAMKNPAHYVRITLEAVLLLLGVKGPREPTTGAEVVDNWRPARTLLANPRQLLASILSFDRDHIPKEVLSKLRKYVESDELMVERVMMCSRAAAALCHWVNATYRYASVLEIYREQCNPLRQRILLLQQQLQDCQRSQPWYQHSDNVQGLEGSTTWYDADVAHAKACQMLELKINCIFAGTLSGRTQPGSADFVQFARDYKRALATLEAWAGDAASMQAAASAACAIHWSVRDEPEDAPKSLSAARVDLWAAMWVPTDADVLEKRECFAALALSLPKIAPVVEVDFNGWPRKSQVCIRLDCGADQFACKEALSKGVTFGSNRLQYRLRICTRLASDGSVCDLDEGDAATSIWTSEEITIHPAMWTPKVGLSYTFTDVPDGVVSACLSIRIGTESIWSAWSNYSDESEVLFPPPKPQGELSIVRVSATAAILQWPYFHSDDRITRIQYRVVARPLDVYMRKAFKSKSVDECDVWTTLMVHNDSKRDSPLTTPFRVTGLSPGSSYHFAVDARYTELDGDILNWSAFLQTETAVLTRHELPASFSVSVNMIGGGDPILFDVAASENVASLKCLLSKRLFIPTECLKICSASLALADTDILGDYYDNDCLSLVLIVDASIDKVRNLLEKCAEDDSGKAPDAAFEALEFMLKSDDCGLAVFQMYKQMGRSHWNKFLAVAKDLADVALSGASLTAELRMSLLALDALLRSASPVVGCVFTALARRGDQLALSEMKEMLFHNSSQVREGALEVVLNSVDENIRNDVVDSYVKKLKTKLCIQKGLPNLEILALLAPREPTLLLKELRQFFAKCRHSPSKVAALKVIGELDPESDDIVELANHCFHQHELELVRAAISVLTQPQLEVIELQNNWPFIKRAAAQVTVDRLGTRFKK